MLPNFRYALRTLLKSPGFALISLLTLALGIGVNSSMFSLMNTLLFATAPFPRPESIIGLNGQTPAAEFINFSAPEIEELRGAAHGAVTAVAPLSGTMETVSLPDQLPEQVQGTAAKADLFTVLETPPLLGRTFTAEECVAGRDTVVLLTEEMWRKRFGAKPDVLGQTLRISGRVFTIIGVLPQAYSAPFIFGEGQYFRPLVFSKEQQEGRERREAGLLLRLAPGVTLPQALASLEPVAARWAKDNPRLYPNYHFRAQLAGRVGGSANVAIIVLQLGLAAAILALACANLANLQMARAASRLRDLAIRSALGATRWMLVQQQVTESLVLSVTGGVFGLLIAQWCNQIIGRNIRLGLTSTLVMSIDGRVVGFTAAVSILAGLGFGLIPAWLASLDEILERSRVSRSNFYYYFRSKEDLGFAVLARQVERFDADVIRGLLENEALPARERLERLFRGLTDGLGAAAYRNGCPFGNLAAELSGVHPEFRHRLSAFFRRWEQAVERCVRDGVARGEFRSDVAARRLATALVSQIEGAALLTKTHGHGEPIEAGAHVMLTLLESR